MRGVHGDGLFDQDVFVGGEGEAGVGVVVRVGGCDVDYVDIWVGDEGGVGGVGFGGGEVEGG